MGFLMTDSKNKTRSNRMGGMNDFTGQYKLSKTLRFELRPIGCTADTFKKQFLANDERRHRDYEV